MENVISFNEINFNNLKNKYPSLSNVYFKDDNLIFPNGNIPIENIKLIDENTFNMSEENLYIYISNNFYENDLDKYQKEIEYILGLFTQLIITEEEERILKKFAYDFWLRNNLLLNEQCLNKNRAFLEEYQKRLLVFTKAYQSFSLAPTILTRTYNEILTNSTNKATENIINDNQESLNQGKSLTLTKTKSGLPNIIDEKNTAPLKTTGFISTILVLSLTIGFGIYLALKLL